MKWTRAKVVDKLPEPRSYTVETSDGKVLRRNQQFLKELKHTASDEHSRSELNQIPVQPNTPTKETCTTPKISKDTPRPMCCSTKTPISEPKKTFSGRTVKPPVWKKDYVD